ncbi:hypothetical protein [Streptomyces sp. S816]|nr:hypothetical protein [Streptomyces sp. S816]
MERFPGYTLSSLLAEDTELMRLVAIEQLGGAHDREEVDHVG